MAKKVYAIRKGYKTGIFYSWDECKKYVNGYSSAKYKSFIDVKDAERYLSGDKQEELTTDNSIEISDDSIFQVFVDGSYNSKRKIAGYGLVIVKNNNVFLKDFSAYPYEDVTKTHNVGAELIGAKRAVELALANGYQKIIINYDYIGIEKFATKAWKAKTNQTREYRDFMQRYMRMLDIHFNKIKAHSGNKYNDMADRLAKFATNL